MLHCKVVYIYSDELKAHCDKLPAMQNRASVVHDLICSYGLCTLPQVVVVKNQNATEEELKSFHSSAYIDLLKSVNSFDWSLDSVKEEHVEYGLGYDCPILENIYNFVTSIAGSSLTAAKLLSSRQVQKVINWFGGWHHANRSGAAGFCYVNDIVLAIQFLSKHFNRILYVDLDAHHGDGVQYAFEYTNQILTVSFHRYDPGFFPNTGSVDDVGKGKGKYYSINVPFKENVKDETLVKTFMKIIPMVLNNFKPDVIVVQCGADSLNEDEKGECNLTLKGYGKCVKKLLDAELPILMLGGGGYNITNAARLWTYLTSLVVEEPLNDDIPEDSTFFSSYGPSFELHITEGRRKDVNSHSYIESLVEKITSQCNFITNI